MDDLKPWWTSKAIWTGLIGSAWGVAGTLGLLPDWPQPDRRTDRGAGA
jgi:hypothetical protein